MKTKKSLHHHIRRLHIHGSVALSVAALLLTSVKCSSEMLRALEAVPMHTAVVDNVFLRDAERENMPVIMHLGPRVTSYGGK